MKYKELKKQNEELQRKLNMANNTVAKQIKEIRRLNDMIDYKNEKFVSEINKFEEHFNNQLELHENELVRRLTIIHYLEDKLYRGRYDE